MKQTIFLQFNLVIILLFELAQEDQRSVGCIRTVVHGHANFDVAFLNVIRTVESHAVMRVRDSAEHIKYVAQSSLAFLNEQNGVQIESWFAGLGMYHHHLLDGPSDLWRKCVCVKFIQLE